MGGGFGTRACYYRVNRDPNGVLEVTNFYGGVADVPFLDATVEEEAAEWKYILDSIRDQEMKRAETNK